MSESAPAVATSSPSEAAQGNSKHEHPRHQLALGGSRGAVALLIVRHAYPCAYPAVRRCWGAP